MNYVTTLKDTLAKPNLQAAIANIQRQGTPERVFQFEHGFESGIKDALCDRFDLCAGLDRSGPDFTLRREIRIYEFVGLEFMRVFPGGIVWPGLPIYPLAPPAVGPIQSWEDFEEYPWPRIEQVDFSAVEWYQRNLPDNSAMWSMVYV